MNFFATVNIVEVLAVLLGTVDTTHLLPKYLFFFFFLIIFALTCRQRLLRVKKRMGVGRILISK